MTAIYKKELRSYFTSMTGYICMAFMLVVIGILICLQAIRISATHCPASLSYSF